MSSKRRNRKAVTVKTRSGVVGTTMNPPADWTGDDATWVDLSFAVGLDTSPFFLGKTGALGRALAVQCADVKARDISKTEMQLWGRDGVRWSTLAPEQHWLAKLFARRPNSIHSWTEFWRMTVLHLELAQNAYILKRITRIGQVTELLPLIPARVRPRISVTGALFYEVAAQTEYERSMLGDSRIVVPADRMVHIRGRLWDGLIGLSNAILGHPTFELLKAINEYQTNLFGNDGKTPLVFETDNVFQGDQADAAFRRLKDQLTERTRKLRARGDPILLEAGLKAKAVAMVSKDASTTESFNQQVLRICGLMQTPPHKIFHYDSVKYDNQAAADNQYANDCLIPIAGNIEEKLRNSLLPEEDWDALYPEFDRQPMVAGDPASLRQWIEVGMKNGLMEVNEGRERMSLNPVEGGDVRTVPVNMAIVDRTGRVVAYTANGQNNNDGMTPSGRALRLVSTQSNG